MSFNIQRDDLLQGSCLVDAGKIGGNAAGYVGA